MLENLNTLWNFELFAVGGAPILAGDLVLVALLLIVGYYGSRFVERLIERRLAAASVRGNVAYMVQRVAFYSMLAAVVLVALSLLNIPLTAFAFISGAVAIGVGFGAQNVINNFLSGWILLAEQPVRIGDFIEVGGERELRLIRSAIRFRIAELFREAGIVIAFPQRDVHLDSARPLQVEVVHGGAGARAS